MVHLPADVARAGPGALAVLTAGLVHAAERALPALPAPLTPPIAELIGTAAYALSPGARAAVRANLRVVAPERADGATVRRVFVERTKQAAHDLERATQAIVGALEGLVRPDPDQWYIFRPMWPERGPAS